MGAVMKAVDVRIGLFAVRAFMREAYFSALQTQELTHDLSHRKKEAAIDFIDEGIGTIALEGTKSAAYSLMKQE